MADFPELRYRDVHVWLAAAEPLSEPVRSKYLELLSEEEALRHSRFRFENKRDEFLVTRALERDVLASYLGRDPKDLAFTRTVEGKPQLASAESGIWFNLSNTRGLVACAVARAKELGVDVENTAAREANLDVARRYFSEAECRALEARPPEERPARFFQYWTLKEAYLKARGLGLSYPLDAFTLEIAPDSAVIHFTSGADDTPQGWQFFHLRPTEVHQLAVGLRSDLPFKLSVFYAIPFSQGHRPR